MKKSHAFIRTLLFPLAASIAVFSFAFADDAVNSDSKAAAETTHDTSHNPLTGNTTETTKTESKMKVGSSSRKMKHVHKKKYNKDGAKIKDETTHNSETTN